MQPIKHEDTITFSHDAVSFTMEDCTLPHSSYGQTGSVYGFRLVPISNVTRDFKARFTCKSLQKKSLNSTNAKSPVAIAQIAEVSPIIGADGAATLARRVLKSDRRRTPTLGA